MSSRKRRREILVLKIIPSYLDGFLTSLVIRPRFTPPGLWLKAVWGRESEPVFESSAQAQRVISLIVRRLARSPGCLTDHPSSRRSFTSTRSMAPATGAPTIGAGGFWRQFASPPRMAVLALPDGCSLCVGVSHTGTIYGNRFNCRRPSHDP
jgi:Uncharacterised protein family (UPF0149)